VADYGLPFSKDPRNVNDVELAPITSDNSGKPLFISSITYNSAGVIKRKSYVRYEGDKYAFSTGFGLPSGNNPRLVASRTVFRDDPSNTYAEVQYSNFDGLGHYRNMQTFGNIGNDSRFEVTQFNMDRGTYLMDPVTNSADSSAHTYTPFPESRPWVLGNYEKVIAAQGGQRSTTWFNFNQKGQLLDKRVRKDFEQAGSAYLLGDKDVLIHYGYDATNGNLVSEAYFGGGKRGGLSMSEAFPALAATAGEYRISYGHQCQKPGGATGTISVVNTKFYLTSSGAVIYIAANDDIDCSTGLAKTTRDNAGVRTDYSYGPMARLNYIKNQQGSYDQIDFQPHGANGYNGLPKVTITRRANGDFNSSSVLAEEIYIYDGLGRLITEKRRMPAGTYQTRQTTYNAMGWVTSKSESIEETASTANKKTIYELFDPFGRPAKITLPDNSIVWMAYKGVREVSRTVTVGTSISSSGVISTQDTNTTETYDRHGRLIMVTQPSGSSGQDGTWSYFYNVNGQLSVVSAVDPSPGGKGQNRAFGYDNLGNLMTESHPERSWAQYSDHDTMGNVGTSYDGLHWLSHSYDSAGRPTTISELSPAGAWRPVKELSYYAANGGTGGTFGAGKLATSIRHNYVLNPYEAHQNVALGKSATQSSSWAGIPASVAVDGNTNGNYFSHTNYDNQAWWQVDLGASYALDQINVWNRTDCCTDRLSNFYVLVSDQPFTSTNLNTTLNQAGVSKYYVSGQGGRPTTVAIGRTGRYLRVQLTGTNYLSLSEVEAIGSSPTIYDVAVNEQYTYSGLDGRVSKQTTSTNIPSGARFEQSFAYDQLGNLSWQTYPKCLNTECVNSGMQRPWTTSYSYASGLLTSVGGGSGEVNTSAGTYASAITYNINGTVATVAHRNGVIDRMALDPNYMQRPRQITATLGANTVFDTGLYSYDGAGNVTRIGNDWYTYDKAGRIREGTALLSGPTGDPTKRLKQQYDYDGFGNRTQTRTYNAASLTGATLKDTYNHNVDSATNRLTLNYDGAGNLLGLPNAAPLYSYDAFNEIITAPGLTYLYGPNEERFWIIDTKQDNDNSNNEETYTVRGLGDEVLREYRVIGGNAVGHWYWQKDYVYRGSALLAAETQSGVRHYLVDHLGSPRLITDGNGTAWERMQFLPFGENSGFYQINNEYWSLMYSGEAVSTRLRFTGHEKDADVIGLTYMHARHYWERSGKFMSVDPGHDWNPSQPQSWNLYSYMRNNPITGTDPTGKFAISIGYWTSVAQNAQKSANMLLGPNPHMGWEDMGYYRSEYWHACINEAYRNYYAMLPGSEQRTETIKEKTKDGAKIEGTVVGLHFLWGIVGHGETAAAAAGGAVETGGLALGAVLGWTLWDVYHTPEAKRENAARQYRREAIKECDRVFKAPWPYRDWDSAIRGAEQPVWRSPIPEPSDYRIPPPEY
jgi:RHS repeat-associated protein